MESNNEDAVNAMLRDAVAEAGSLLIDVKTLLAAQIAEQRRVASELSEAVESAARWLSKAEGDAGLIRGEYMANHDECMCRARVLESELQRRTNEINPILFTAQEAQPWSGPYFPAKAA